MVFITSARPDHQKEGAGEIENIQFLNGVAVNYLFPLNDVALLACLSGICSNECSRISEPSSSFIC